MQFEIFFSQGSTRTRNAHNCLGLMYTMEVIKHLKCGFKIDFIIYVTQLCLAQHNIGNKAGVCNRGDTMCHDGLRTRKLSQWLK